MVIDHPRWVIKLEIFLSPSAFKIRLEISPGHSVVHRCLLFRGDSFYETQQCGFSASQNAVFMSLPPEITIGRPSPDNPNSVILTFEDKAKAIVWEQRMILWGENVKEDETGAQLQLSLVTVWKVHGFQEMLGIYKQDGDNDQETVFAVDVDQPDRSIPIHGPYTTSKPSRSRGADGSYIFRFLKNLFPKTPGI